MPNIIWRPQPKQTAFMARPEWEALYGGAAGGGKSDALVCEALRQVHIPHYKALILRKTFPQLGELIDKSANYYLNGQEIPTIRRMETPGQLGFVWDIYLDWGINVMDFRGAIKNLGVKIENPLN